MSIKGDMMYIIKSGSGGILMALAVSHDFAKVGVAVAGWRWLIAVLLVVI
jgi:hypothetical protein